LRARVRGIGIAHHQPRAAHQLVGHQRQARVAELHVEREQHEVGAGLHLLAAQRPRQALQRGARGHQHARAGVLARQLPHGQFAGQHDALGRHAQADPAQAQRQAGRGVRGVVRDDGVAPVEMGQQLGRARNGLLLAHQRAVEVDQEVARARQARIGGHAAQARCRGVLAHGGGLY
jgi:hypothetical protein